MRSHHLLHAPHLRARQTLPAREPLHVRELFVFREPVQRQHELALEKLRRRRVAPGSRQQRSAQWAPQEQSAGPGCTSTDQTSECLVASASGVSPRLSRADNCAPIAHSAASAVARPRAAATCSAVRRRRSRALMLIECLQSSTIEAACPFAAAQCTGLRFSGSLEFGSTPAEISSLISSTRPLAAACMSWPTARRRLNCRSFCAFVATPPRSRRGISGLAQRPRGRQVPRAAPADWPQNATRSTAQPANRAA